MRVLVAVALASVVTAQAPPKRSFIDVMTSYRSGQFERAADEAASRTDPSFWEQEDRWLDHVRQAGGSREIEAAFLLQTEVTFRVLQAYFNRDPAQLRAEPPTSLIRLKRLHNIVASSDRRSSFLHNWYLLWGSFLQAINAADLIDETNDYVAAGLRAFPDDPELLLMKGSAKEMIWWMGMDNPQRRPDGKKGAKESALREASECFRKSAAAGTGPVEASRLRLGRTLMALEDYDAALTQIEPLRSVTGDPPMTYLANLFAGEIYERRGQLEAAGAAYDAAMRAVPWGQSAQIAAAHVAHRTNARKQAAELVQRALSQKSDRVDPWWWYIRGQAGQYETRLTAAREAVKQ